MSQENVETIARLYDEFLARPERVSDPKVLQFFDPGVEIRQSASFIGTEGTFHGYDGLARSAREAFEVFPGPPLGPHTAHRRRRSRRGYR